MLLTSLICAGRSGARLERELQNRHECAGRSPLHQRPSMGLYACCHSLRAMQGTTKEERQRAAAAGGGEEAPTPITINITAI